MSRPGQARTRSIGRRLPAFFVAAAIAASAMACSSDSKTSGSQTSGSKTATPDPISELIADFHISDGDKLETFPAGIRLTRGKAVVHTSLGQLDARGLEVGSKVTLKGEGIEDLAGTVDDQGAVMFRDLSAGKYTLSAGAQEFTDLPVGSHDERTAPSQDFYDAQDIPGGYGYLTTRDGTTLSINVVLPGPADAGPYPTVVEYSGYTPSKPVEPLYKNLGLDDAAGEAACVSLSVLCHTPDQPSSLLSAAFGYAVVGVNVRGTGCSGGAFDYAEEIQRLDGYDVIEAIAAQPWVKGHKVGMVGLSYPGIMQLYVAETQPPSLAAIAPMSVLSDIWDAVGRPGWLFNKGFAKSWLENVQGNANPYGQSWIKDLIADGDKQCDFNQGLRGQNRDNVERTRSFEFLPEIAYDYAAYYFADKINVPVLMTGEFQDGQTGGRWPILIERLTDSPSAHFIAMNGVHADGLSPEISSYLDVFLDIYVAGEMTDIPALVRQSGPELFESTFKAKLKFRQDLGYYDLTLEQATKKWEESPKVRVLLERGATGDQPGAAEGGYEFDFTKWPVDGVDPLSLYLGDDASLGDSIPVENDSESTYRYNAALGDITTLVDGGQEFWAQAEYDWQAAPDGEQVVFQTQPLQQDTVLIGPGSADLWIKVDAPDGASQAELKALNDAAVGVVLSDVRPDNSEVFVQGGALLISRRALADDATELWPNHSYSQDGYQPIKPGEYNQARIEFYSMGHIFRKGSRIRLAVHTPGLDFALWKFENPVLPAGTTISIGHDSEHASKVVLPRVNGLAGWDESEPACNALRGQPCRTAVALKP